MSPQVLNIIVLAVATGAIGWCVWHCLRGIHAMRRGEAPSCCPPDKTTITDAATRLAALRHELDQLKTGRRDTMR